MCRFNSLKSCKETFSVPSSTLHSPSWTEIFSSYLYAFIIYPSINQNSSSALHYKDGKNIFLTRYLTPTIFQKYHDNHIFLNVQNRYKNMTASKFHPIDAIKNRVSKNSAPSEHDTKTYTLTRLTSFTHVLL